MKLNDRSGPETEQAWAKTGSKLTLEVVDGDIKMAANMSPREALVALLAAVNLSVSAIIAQGVQVGVSPEDTRKFLRAAVQRNIPALEDKP